MPLLYWYDALGRLQTKSLHGNATNKLTYSYNIRDWLTGISGSKLTQNLYYNTGSGTAQYGGNITGLQRYGQTSSSAYGLIDNLTYTLSGNQATRVDDATTAAAYNNGFEFKDAVKQANEYAYGKNGNLTKDLNKNITGIQYNCLNLPSKVTFDSDR